MYFYVKKKKIGIARVVIRDMCFRLCLEIVSFFGWIWKYGYNILKMNVVNELLCVEIIIVICSMIFLGFWVFVRRRNFLRKMVN